MEPQSTWERRTELMVFNAATNSLTREDPTVAGQVLAVSPDGGSIIISDPRKKLIYLYSTATSTGSGTTTGTGTGTTTTATTATSNYGGVATHAQFTQDSQTVYITLGTPDASDPTNPDKFTPTNQLLVHSTFTGWSQVSLPNASLRCRHYGSKRGCVSCRDTSDRSELLRQHDHLSRNRYRPDCHERVLSPGRYGRYDGNRPRGGATNDGLRIMGATAAQWRQCSPTLTFNSSLPPASHRLPTPMFRIQQSRRTSPGSCPVAVSPDYFKSLQR